MRTVHSIKIIEPAWIILVIIIKYIIFTVVITLRVAYIIIVIVVINIIIWVIICFWDLIVRMNNVYNMSNIFLVVTLLWYGYWDCWFSMIYVIWQVIFYRWVTNTFTRLIIIVAITDRPGWSSSKLYVLLLMIIFIIIILGLILFLIFDLR